MGIWGRVAMQIEATEAASFRDIYASLRRESLITHNLIVGGGSVTAGLLGFAFQSLFAHQLRPADYGAAFAVITLITLIGLPASAFTLLMARETSRGAALGDARRSAALLANGNRALLLLGTGLGALLALSSPLFSRFLDAPIPMILAAAVGVPFGLALPLLAGEFQGEQRFLALAVVLAGQAALKLVAAIGLAIAFGPLGVIAGISLAGFVTYALACWLLRAKVFASSDVEWFRPAIGYLAIVIPSSLALALLLSADVLLVKHYFGSTAAGEYSAVAALGRAIFWGAAAVSAVLFPKVVLRTTQGQRTLAVVIVSLLVVAVGGLLGLAVLSIASKWLLTAFAGSAYVGAATYLPWYALGMTLLGGVSVLIATHQSHGRAGFLVALIPLSILEPLLIVLLHRSLLQVVQVVDVSMGLVAFGLAGWYLAEERARRPIAVPAVGSPAHMGAYQ
jgi:O-antigen/teichoic acid export membrane protein